MITGSVQPACDQSHNAVCSVGLSVFSLVRDGVNGRMDDCTAVFLQDWSHLSRNRRAKYYLTDTVF